MMSSSVGLKVWVLFLAITTVMPTNPLLVAMNLRKFANADNEFAWRLFQHMTRTEAKNVFISPLSITHVLVMLLHGAKGQTLKELRTALNFEKEDLSDEVIQKMFKHFISFIYSKDTSRGYTLNSANRILVEKSLKLVSEYKEDVKRFYNASIQSVDFKNKATEVKDEINDWVEEQTHGKIKDFLDDVHPDWEMILLNAIYFKGSWKIPFNPKDTQKMPFHNHGKDTKPKQVDTMYVSNFYFYSFTDDYEAVFIPYDGNRTEMLILLPSKGKSLPAFVKSLNSTKLHRIIADKYQMTELDLYLPKFKFEFKESLTEHLIALGITTLRDTTLNLSGMIDAAKVKINEIIHKTFIEVTEEGTEGAAATGTLQTISEKIELYVNKPFVFFIIDRERNTILFMGQVAEL